MAIFVLCGKCTSATTGAVSDSLRHPAARQVSFSYRSLTVNAAYLARVARRIRSGLLPVTGADPTLPPRADASYDSRTNAFSFRDQIPTPHLAIHEAIHCLQDEMRVPFDRAEREATANVGEAQYRLARAQYEWGSYHDEVRRILESGNVIDAAAVDVVLRKDMLRRPSPQSSAEKLLRPEFT